MDGHVAARSRPITAPLPFRDAGGGRGSRVHRERVAARRVSRSIVRVFSEAGTPDVENLYARFGTGQPYLLFAGHTDVVPPGDVERGGTTRSAGVIDGGELYGRGAVDMKGGIACMMAAALRFIADRPDFEGSIGFLITGDEEGPAINGTVKLLDWARARGERFDHCILGEPTNPEPARRHDQDRAAGFAHRARSWSRASRGMWPIRIWPRTRSPADAAARRPLRRSRSTRGTEHFDASNLEVTTFDVGNPAANVIAAQARATFNVRFNDTLDAGEPGGRNRPAPAGGSRQRQFAIT